MIDHLKLNSAIEESGVPRIWKAASNSVKTGYEINFAQYSHKPRQLRSLEEISADILEPAKETEGLLEEIVGGEKP